MANRSNNKLRIPPQNIEAEKALLGSIMLQPESVNEIFDTVSADSFYAEKHRIIWRAMIDLFSKGNPIDLLSLSARLKEKDELDQIGGNTYITEIISAVPTSTNIRHYAEIVRKKYTMRNLISASEKILDLGYNEAAELEELLDSAEKHLFKVTNFSGTHKFIELKDALDEAWDRLDILAARPSMGKTSLALDIARQAAVNHNVPVCIFSLEMSSQQLVDRMLAAEARVDAWRLRTGKLSIDEEFDKLRDSLARLSKSPIYIDDQPGNNIIKMRAVSRRLKTDKKLGLIIVDYLQLMLPPGGARYSDSFYQQVTEISRALKNLAREIEVPVMALSQLSRAVEQRGGKPRLSDLRDSGSIEQDADVVMFIHREDRYNENSDKPNIAEIMIEKHRNGPTGKVELYFDADKSTFLSIDKSVYSDFKRENEKF